MRETWLFQHRKLIQKGSCIFASGKEGDSSVGVELGLIPNWSIVISFLVFGLKSNLVIQTWRRKNHLLGRGESLIAQSYLRHSTTHVPHQVDSGQGNEQGVGVWKVGLDIYFLFHRTMLSYISFCKMLFSCPGSSVPTLVLGLGHCYRKVSMGDVSFIISNVVSQNVTFTF